MRISVIIPCYNSDEALDAAVRSALDQTLPPMEIICVDDASGNDTPERLSRLQTESGGRLRVLRRTERGGIGGARNTGFEVAGGDWIALLDHDDLWLPEKLARQAELATDSPEAVLLHTRCWEQSDHDPSSRVLMHATKFIADTEPFPYLFLSNYIAPCTVLIRKDVLRQVGGFDPRFDRHGKDDIDLWLKLSGAGHRFAHIEEPLAIRRLHAGNYSRDLGSFQEGRYRVLIEHFEEDRAGLRRLLATEGLVRLLGVAMSRVALQLQAQDTPGPPPAWGELEELVSRIPALLRGRTWNERLGGWFPTWAPKLAERAQRRGRADAEHAIECGLALRRALDTYRRLAHIGKRRGFSANVTRKLARDAAHETGQAAPWAYHRRSQYETVHAEPLRIRR